MAHGRFCGFENSRTDARSEPAHLEWCGACMRLETSLPRFDRRPACSVYRCEKCGFIVWIKAQGKPTPPLARRRQSTQSAGQNGLIEPKRWTGWNFRVRNALWTRSRPFGVPLGGNCMDKKIAGLLGAVAALTAVDGQAAPLPVRRWRRERAR